ncbi:TetR/AcrR family transcriptional regulator [Marinobacter sp. SS21]|uniref:TetR/AcrR family transcriptional regulator n=1 Tax=Marinobacter sp. SS21 TaxID=2979460 RepID=UPI00232E2EAF|nr:TetR family transcriptional regulator [Marinobacter sp. SS21]MDC0662841.1 TetR family transcriptional regulator [Marinobacter sp. SS21]
MSAIHQPDSTRQKILLTALELFAAHGLDGVSLRTISAESGTRNSAAAHYHFGNRLGLIDGILTMITDYLEPQFESAFQGVEQAPGPTLRDVVKAMCAPYLSLLSGTPPWGSAALRFMAHLHTDNTQPVIRLLNQHFRADLERIELQLHRVLPQTDRATLRLRLGFTLVNLIHGAAEIHLLATSPFGDIRPDDATLFHQFVDYVEGGLGFNSPDR